MPMLLKLLQTNHFAKLLVVMSAMFLNPATLIKITKNFTVANNDSRVESYAISLTGKVGTGRKPMRSPHCFLFLQHIVRYVLLKD